MKNKKKRKVIHPWSYNFIIFFLIYFFFLVIAKVERAHKIDSTNAGSNPSISWREMPVYIEDKTISQNLSRWMKAKCVTIKLFLCSHDIIVFFSWYFNHSDLLQNWYNRIRPLHALSHKLFFCRFQLELRLFYKII